MARPGLVPQTANEFIEQQLDLLAGAVGHAFSSDTLAFSGPLLFGVDDLIRSSIEQLRAPSKGKGRVLTVLVSTQGGYIEVVQRIVETIRFHYRRVNFVVPDSAFSAGTVLVMSGDTIWMDYYSRLGPIDPQVDTAKGVPVPALGYLIQWDRLLEKARKGTLTVPEIQLMIDGFDQAELYKYEQARNLSITLLKEWLVKYKFRNWKQTTTRRRKVTKRMRIERAEQVAAELNNTDRWHTHGRGISREVLRQDLKLKIDDLEGSREKATTVKNYHGLLADYMQKRSKRGTIHIPGRYLPFM